MEHVDHMDWIGLAAFITAIGGLVGIILNFVKGVIDKRQLKNQNAGQQAEIDDLKAFKHGQILRGFVGAEMAGIVGRNEFGKRVITDKWKERVNILFGEQKAALKRLRKQLRYKLKRDPTEIELGEEIDSTQQWWLVDNVCRGIERTQYECVAVAYAVACENGSTDHTHGSWEKKLSPVQ